jgi:hypothetical protein
MGGGKKFEKACFRFRMLALQIGVPKERTMASYLSGPDIRIAPKADVPPAIAVVLPPPVSLIPAVRPLPE